MSDDNGVVLTDDMQIADHINDYFANIGCTLAQNIQVKIGIEETNALYHTVLNDNKDNITNNYMGAYLGKGTYWQCFHKLDSRENSLINTTNHFKIFLIGSEICLYEHLYFLYIRNPLFPIVAFISMFWQLKVNMFYPKNSFPIV